jgi:enoyl-CoA hydratase
VGEDALQTAKELAAAILKNGPVALALAKEAVGRGENLDLQEALEVEADLFGLACATQDMREGTKAFLEKRPAQFKGE